MIFKIKSVGYPLKPLEEVYPVLKEFNFKQASKEGWHWVLYWGVIHIDSLEELIKLKESIGKRLIISESDDCKQKSITIYDDYIE